MTDTLRQMKRVMQVRKVRERMGEGELAVAAATLRDAESRLTKANQAARELQAEQVRMLLGGTREAVAMSSGLRKAFGLDVIRSESERAHHEGQFLKAQSALRARKVEAEQAKAICDNARKAVTVEMERRTQTETVDRFLARSRWSSAKIRVRKLSEAA